MKEGIHPQFEKTTITCHCGNVIETRSLRRTLRLKSVQSAIRSILASKSLLIQVDVLTDLKSVSIWTSKNKDGYVSSFLHFRS